MKDNKIICYCSNVTMDEIVNAIESGSASLEDIRKITKACTIGHCKELSPKKKCCSTDIQQILEKYIFAKK